MPLQTIDVTQIAGIAGGAILPTWVPTTNIISQAAPLLCGRGPVPDRR